MRVLLTGVTGFLGSAVGEALVDAGAVVHTLVRPSRRRAEPGSRSTRVTRHSADLRVWRAVRQVVQAVAPEVVVHLAAAGVRKPFLPVQIAVQHNVVGTMNLLRALTPPTRVVMGRTPGEAVAMNPYSATKAAAWEIARMFARTQGLPVLGVMPFHVYGPTQPAGQLLPAAIQAALAGADFPMTHGEQLRDWIFVDDVVRAFLQAAAAGNEGAQTAEIGTGVGTTLRELIATVYELVGRGGQPLLGAIAARSGEVPHQVADAATAERLLGWRSRVPLRKGLKRTIAGIETAARGPR